MLFFFPLSSALFRCMSRRQLIHAIREAQQSRGEIVVTIVRGPAQQRTGESEELGPVSGFTVQDNGVGFTLANLTSFETTDSGWKRTRGGKGIGRLLWLKAFSRAEVDSTYQEQSEWRRRQFTFSLPEGITGLQDSDASDERRSTYPV